MNFKTIYVFSCKQYKISTSTCGGVVLSSYRHRRCGSSIGNLLSLVWRELWGVPLEIHRLSHKRHQRVTYFQKKAQRVFNLFFAQTLYIEHYIDLNQSKCVWLDFKTMRLTPRCEQCPPEYFFTIFVWLWGPWNLYEINFVCLAGFQNNVLFFSACLTPRCEPL